MNYTINEKILEAVLSGAFHHLMILLITKIEEEDYSDSLQFEAC
jgi:hypothetical protein